MPRKKAISLKPAQISIASYNYVKNKKNTTVNKFLKQKIDEEKKSKLMPRRFVPRIKNCHWRCEFKKNCFNYYDRLCPQISRLPDNYESVGEVVFVLCGEKDLPPKPKKALKPAVTKAMVKTTTKGFTGKGLMEIISDKIIPFTKETVHIQDNSKPKKINPKKLKKFQEKMKNKYGG